MRKSKVSAEHARLNYNQACEDYANGDVTLDDLINAARHLVYAQKSEREERYKISVAQWLQ